jgi:hypothetical protein
LKQMFCTWVPASVEGLHLPGRDGGAVDSRPVCAFRARVAVARYRDRFPLRFVLAFILVCAFCFTAALPLRARIREKDGVQYGAGLIVNIPLPEAQVAQAVEDVTQNGIIRGTKEYNKDEYVTGATPAPSSRAFHEWQEGGKVFYKIRAHALDPRNFKDSGDVGTLAVRYVLQAQGDNNTILRIDAVFVEDFRHATHESNGSVESAEYKDIHDHLEAVELMKKETAETERERQRQLATKQLGAGDDALLIGTSSSRESPAVAQSDPDNTSKAGLTDVSVQSSTAQSLEQRVLDLRRRVERRVKDPGAALKAAPFRTASSLKSLTTGTEVLVLISTPYWYGVETHDGQHGWISRDQLEQLP